MDIRMQIIMYLAGLLETAVPCAGVEEIAKTVGRPESAVQRSLTSLVRAEIVRSIDLGDCHSCGKHRGVDYALNVDEDSKQSKLFG